MNNIPTMLTIKETAQKSGLAEHYIRQLCKTNKIVSIRCGSKYLINFEKMIEFLNTGDKQENEKADTYGQIRRLG